MNFPENEHENAPEASADKSIEILAALYEEFAQHGFTMTHLSVLRTKLDDTLWQMQKNGIHNSRLYEARGVKMLEYFVERIPAEQQTQKMLLMERLKTEHDLIREDHKTREARHRDFITRKSPFALIHERAQNDKTLSMGKKEQDITKITDKDGNIIGIVIHGRFQWLCSKADVGKILAYLREIQAMPQSVAELAKRAINLLPEIARSPNNNEAIESAIKDAKKIDRTATKIHLETAVNAVRQYL
jgi:hypothetical protein